MKSEGARATIAGAEAHAPSATLTARLKPCPFYKTTSIEFFRSLLKPHDSICKACGTTEVVPRYKALLLFEFFRNLPEDARKGIEVGSDALILQAGKKGDPGQQRGADVGDVSDSGFEKRPRRRDRACRPTYIVNVNPVSEGGAFASGRRKEDAGAQGGLFCHIAAECAAFSR